MKIERELFETWYRANFEDADHEKVLVWNDGGYIDHDVNLLYKGWLASTQADRWVSVDDKLPYEDEDVLVCCNGGTFFVDCLSDGVAGNEAVFVNAYLDCWDVEHWMPLPRKPIKE